MDIPLPDDVQSQLKAFQDASTRLCAALQPFLAQNLHDVEEELEPCERADMHLALTTAVVAAWKMRLRAAGANMEKAGVAKEEERLGVYARKIKKAQSAKWLKEHRPTASVNVSAANRFIDRAIPDLTQEQRQRLKEAGQKHAVQAETEQPSKSARRREDAKAEAAAFLAKLL